MGLGAGSASAITTALGSLTPGGRVVVVALHERPAELSLTGLMMGETEIVGAESMLAGPDNPLGDGVTFRALNANFTSIGGGTDQIQRNIIGERVLGLPKEPEIDRTIPFREVRAG